MKWRPHRWKLVDTQPDPIAHQDRMFFECRRCGFKTSGLFKKPSGKYAIDCNEQTIRTVLES